MPHALLVDDHAGTVSALATLLAAEGFSSTRATNLREAREALAAAPPDIILLDLHLPDGDGMRLIDELDPATSPAVVLITGQASVATAVEALRRGVSDYLIKPVDPGRLRSILREVGESLVLKRDLTSARARLATSGRFGHLVGASPRMHTVTDQIARVAPTSAAVLVTGESGTGKELVARTLHECSRRRRGPFVAVNCSALSATLAESQLFGHERGSFTGAERRHRGIFEQAAGGTLFLDEITEMPFDLQAKFLRVIETSTFARTGGEDPLTVDVRIVSATNIDPDEAVRRGRLREDLYYRLKVFELALPPLRERQDDVVLLARHFLSGIQKTEQGAAKWFSPETVARLRRYHWPGNVRQLKNAVYTAFILADAEITPECLPAEITAEPGLALSGPAVDVRVGMTVADVERRVILATLAHHNGNKAAAAETLGISLKTLYNRLNAFKLQAAKQGA